MTWDESYAPTMSDVTPESSPSVRLILPVALAVVALRGTTMPWVTVRNFNGGIHRYNLTDVKGGIGILMTVLLFAIVGAVIAIMRRLAGLTVLSIACAIVGWLAAISGLLLGVASTFLPSINVAGLDLTRALVAQGSGIAVTVVATLSLAFIVVRQFEPLSRYSNRNRVSLLPLCAVLPLLVLSVNMHSEWILLGNDQTSMRAIVAGDSLYGSGLVVLALWMTIGIWIAALIVQRPLVARCAGGVSIITGLVVLMYASFLWMGGKALAWLIPNKVENWASVRVAPLLYVVLLAAVGLLICGILAFVNQAARRSVALSDVVVIGGRTVYSTDLLGVFLVVGVIVSLIVAAI